MKFPEDSSDSQSEELQPCKNQTKKSQDTSIQTKKQTTTIAQPKDQLTSLNINSQKTQKKGKIPNLAHSSEDSSDESDDVLQPRKNKKPNATGKFVTTKADRADSKQEFESNISGIGPNQNLKEVIKGQKKIQIKCSTHTKEELASMAIMTESEDNQSSSDSGPW